ncbi:DUF1801 domain-containing protein [Henriciella pelagia]|jgi:hypothetical protein|uniref:YdhG-like domain-containing protein n=1 Tax=Henriciella pelagia TaxID=1977912 RepID=A0ABQ1J2U8_9PROT|nr:DUF1801 domain-containing protein [Henriciella pelagia]GGB58531.1 hypothetical protein GCM10011503_03660 [Henriciella pelagia]
MAKSDNKTKQTEQSPEAFIASIDHKTRRADAERLLEIFSEVTNLEPRMWGPSIIGFGRYHYKYESGREGDFLMTGFSPRKANLVIYILPGYLDLSDKLERLGKHKLGKSCLYINKLADVDEGVLREVIDFGVQYMRAKYETWDD